MSFWPRSLTRIQLRLARRWRMLRGRRAVHLLHIGKTGGTAVKHALRRAPQASLTWCLHPHEVRLADIPRGEPVVFFVRDPIRRFLSGFLSRQRQGRPRYHVRWSPEEALAFQHFPLANDLAEALSPADPRHDLALRAMRGIGHVRDSYWDWFGSESYLLQRAGDILLVGRQETLAADFARLRQLLSLPASVALPTDEKEAHRNPAQLDRHLSPAACENLRVWYERDYEFLEFCSAHFEMSPLVARPEYEPVAP